MRAYFKIVLEIKSLADKLRTTWNRLRLKQNNFFFFRNIRPTFQQHVGGGSPPVLIYSGARDHRNKYALVCLYLVYTTTVRCGLADANMHSVTRGDSIKFKWSKSSDKMRPAKALFPRLKTLCSNES